MSDNNKSSGVVDRKNIDKYHSNLIETASKLRNKYDWKSKYPFYMLSSDLSIVTIKDTVENTYMNVPGKEMKPIGLIKAIWSNNEETDRTLCVIDKNVYEKMKGDNYHIEPYIPHKYDLPKEKETRNLFIKLPLIPQLNKLSLCQQHLNSRMNTLIMYGIWNKQDFSIAYPEKSREKDIHGRKAFIVFYVSGKSEEEKVDILDKITLTRNFLSGTNWPGTSFKINCYWAKESKKRKVTSVSKEIPIKPISVPIILSNNTKEEKNTSSNKETKYTKIKKSIVDEDGFTTPKYHQSKLKVKVSNSNNNAWSKPLNINQETK